MRVTRQTARLARRTQKLGADDWMVRFKPSAHARRHCPGLPCELACRLIRYQKPGFRPSWLLTSILDAEPCSRDELVELYHCRWSIETIYREWKHGLDIQNLRSHTRLGILKEVHAQLILSNLARWIMTEATNKCPQTPLDISFLTTLTKIKAGLPKLLYKHRQVDRKLYRRLLLDVVSSVIRKRPGRSYPRTYDGKIKDKGGGRYQLPAKMKKIA